MAHKKPEGSFVALVTPMNEDGSIDYEGFRTLLNWHHDHGTSAVLIMGSTGEVSMLSAEERREIVEKTVKMRPGDMQMFYGCTGNNTETTIGYVRHAKAAGADGAIVAAPAYIGADNEAITDFMFEVLDSADLAMGFYNNPPRVKTDLHWTDLLKLARHDNMVVLKESTTRVGQVAQICAAKPDMSIMCCCSPNLGLVVPTMALGGHGTANMTGNIIPEEMVTISTPWRKEGAADAFREAYLRNLPILHFVYSAINPVATKTIMRALGLPSGPLRKPLKPLAPTALEAGLNAYRELELDRKYGLNIRPALAAE
ncbi:dihydrodipicolinate synthase family protein [Chelativorans sp. Marseille-P2723]|uniref:dihydrodipicolinate synthase family protein n=1 Tax=Chelativorans sp. Marseille-P2723 TaxID=2709133 RepID=UPI00157016E1|nr:dihydrodipicolinate synthase family protein [Chelativorans sp. Marseille-P2723]